MQIEGKVNVEYVGLCDDFDGGVEISQNGTVVQSVYCYNANEITFSEEARVIATGALQRLGGFTDMEFFCSRLVIPKGIEKIEPGAFYHLDNAETVMVDEENSVYTAVDNVIFTKDMKTLVWCPPRISGWFGTYAVPEGTEEIAALAFGVTCLKNLILPKTLKKYTLTDEDSGIKDCFFYDDYTNLEKIIGVPGSRAEELAKEVAVEFVDIDEWDEDDES